MGHGSPAVFDPGAVFGDGGFAAGGKERVDVDDDGAGGSRDEGEVDEDFFGEGGGGERGDLGHGLVQVEEGGPAVGFGGLEGVLDFGVWVFGRFEEFGGPPVFDEDFEIFGLGNDVDGVGFGFVDSADEVGDATD